MSPPRAYGRARDVDAVPTSLFIYPLLRGALPWNSTVARAGKRAKPRALIVSKSAPYGPSDGVTAPCQADFTITNVSFVSGPWASRLAIAVRQHPC